jgi:hypothetical protein
MGNKREMVKQMTHPWKSFKTAPKDGLEILVCNTRQGNVKALLRWNRVHEYWQSKGVVDVAPQWTHWMPIPILPQKGTA